jgi:hypothetical protein
MVNTKKKNFATKNFMKTKNIVNRKLFVFYLAIILIVSVHADNQAWKQIDINSSNSLKKIFDEYSVIAIIKYNPKEGQSVVNLLKGEWMNKTVVTKEIYELHKEILMCAGDYYCMHLSKHQQEREGAAKVQSLIVELPWNEKPDKIGVRSITREKPSKAKLKAPELYVTIEDISKYFVAAECKSLGDR